jgi:L-amino acid N-acyltransferase YncA
MVFLTDEMKVADWEQVRSIYLDGIRTGNSTFETEPPEWNRWDRSHLTAPRLVVRSPNGVLAWAALSPVSGRCVYAGVVEISLYVSAECRGQGLGSILLQALIEATEKAGIWMLQGGIFPENAASLAMVKKHGFREVGRRERLGRMSYGPFAGTWRDVVLVERRSQIIGIE